MKTKQLNKTNIKRLQGNTLGYKADHPAPAQHHKKGIPGVLDASCGAAEALPCGQAGQGPRQHSHLSRVTAAQGAGSCSSAHHLRQCISLSALQPDAGLSLAAAGSPVCSPCHPTGIR